MALKLAEEQAQREENERKEEEANNPMKLLENRTQQSKHELELLESLEELKDLNRRQQTIDFDAMLSQFDTREAKEKLKKLQEERDEQYIKSVFAAKKYVIEEEVVEEEVCHSPPRKKLATESNKSMPSSTSDSQNKTNKDQSWNKSVGVMSKQKLSGLVRVNKPNNSEAPAETSVKETSVKTSGLSLLGSYGDSDGSESSD